MTIIILFLCLSTIGYAQQSLPSTSDVIYVMEKGQGNGTSWKSPLGNLQQALKIARRGQSIWVAAGTYYTTHSNNRNIAFRIPGGVKVLGGFAGYETHHNQRDFYTNLTILSGNIGSPDVADNAYTVVRFDGADEQTVIDGLTIEGGYAMAQSNNLGAHNCGGGIFNDASRKPSNPRIINCTLQNNSANYGGGLYNFAQNGYSALTLENTLFLQNIAKFDGGAIMNEASQGKGNIQIIGCEFFQNKAYYGAAVHNKVIESGEASPLIANTNFEQNTAFMKGATIFNLRTGAGVCKPVVTGCIFTNNEESLATPKRVTDQPVLQQKSYNIRRTK